MSARRNRQNPLKVMKLAVLPCWRQMAITKLVRERYSLHCAGGVDYLKSRKIVKLKLAETAVSGSYMKIFECPSISKAAKIFFSAPKRHFAYFVAKSRRVLHFRYCGSFVCTAINMGRTAERTPAGERTSRLAILITLLILFAGGN